MVYEILGLVVVAVLIWAGFNWFGEHVKIVDHKEEDKE